MIQAGAPEGTPGAARPPGAVAARFGPHFCAKDP